MNIYAVETSVLLQRKKTVEQDISDIKKALQFVPPSSILGRLSLTSSLTHKERELRKINGELVLRGEMVD